MPPVPPVPSVEAVVEAAVEAAVAKTSPVESPMEPARATARKGDRDSPHNEEQDHHQYLDPLTHTRSPFSRSRHPPGTLSAPHAHSPPRGRHGHWRAASAVSRPSCGRGLLFRKIVRQGLSQPQARPMQAGFHRVHAHRQEGRDLMLRQALDLGQHIDRPIQRG